MGKFQKSDSADTCAGKFPLTSMGGWAEGLACADPGSEDPHRRERNFVHIAFTLHCLANLLEIKSMGFSCWSSSKKPNVLLSVLQFSEASFIFHSSCSRIVVVLLMLSQANPMMPHKWLTIILMFMTSEGVLLEGRLSQRKGIQFPLAWVVWPD